MRMRALLLICLHVFCGIIYAQKPTFKVVSDSNSVRIASPFMLHFHIENAKNKEIQYPDFLDSINAHFDILKVHKNDTTENSVVLNYEVASYEFGSFFIGPFPFRYEENGIMLNDSSNSILVEVYAPEVDTTKGYMDIYGPMDMPFSWKEMVKPVSIGAGVLLAIILLVYLIIRYIKYRKAKNKVVVEYVEPPIDPFKDAREHWEKLKEQNAAVEFEPKLFYTSITDILRVYFERTLHFNAPEMISDEILDSLKSKKVDPSIYEYVRSILQNSDLAKFAKSTPTVEIREFDLDKTWLVIEKLHSSKEGGSK